MTLGNYGVSLNRPYINTNNGFHFPQIFRKSIKSYSDSTYLKTDSEESIRFASAAYNGNVIAFKKPIIMMLSKDKYGMYLDNDYLDIHCFGDNKDELFEDFNETVFSLKEAYLDCNANELSSSGMVLRNRLKEYYDGIQR